MISKRIGILFFLLSTALYSFAIERLSLIPQDSQTYIRVSNASEFINRLEQSPMGKLWNDPQFRSFLGNPEDNVWKDILFDKKGDAEKAILSDQLKMTSGEIILGYDINRDISYFIAAITKEDFLRSLEQDEQLSEMEDNPFDIVNHSFQDTSLIEHITNGGTEKQASSWQAYINGTLLQSESREWIEQSVTKLKEARIDEPQGDPKLDLNIEASLLIQKFIDEKEEKTDPANPQSQQDMKQVCKALGLLEIQSLDGQVVLKEDKAVADCNLHVTDLTKGLFTVLDVRPVDLPTVTFIPPGITSIKTGRFDLLKLWKELPVICTGISPTTAMQFSMIPEMIRQQTGVDFEEDVLSKLDTRYISYSVVDAETAQLESISGIGLKEPSGFRTTLETILSAPALEPQITAMLESEPFMDHTLYTTKNASGDNPACFGVAGDYLFFGSPKAVRAVIRSQSSTDAEHTSFENSPLVKGLRQTIPSTAFSYGATDWKKNMDAIIRQLNNPIFIGLFKKRVQQNCSMIDPDFENLPPADHISSFFNTSCQYTESGSDGLHQRIILKY